MQKSPVTGGYCKVTLSSIVLLYLGGVGGGGGGGGGGMKISIYRLIWGVGGCQARGSVGSLWLNMGNTVGSRGIVKINLSIICIFCLSELFWY